MGGEGIWYDPEYVGGIEIFDVLVPTHPVRVGGIDTGGFVQGIQIAGNYPATGLRVAVFGNGGGMRP